MISSGFLQCPQAQDFPRFTTILQMNRQVDPSLEGGLFPTTGMGRVTASISLCSHILQVKNLDRCSSSFLSSLYSKLQF